MSEEIIFHNTLLSIIEKFSEDSVNFLLISIDRRSVQWIIKIPDNTLSDDFVNLLKFTLPVGVKILGFFYLGKFDTSSTDTRSNKCYSILKTMEKKFPNNFLDSRMLTIKCDPANVELFFQKSLDRIEVTGKSYEFNEQKGKLELKQEIKFLRFKNLTEYINTKFFQISAYVKPLVLLNKANFLINESYLKGIGLYFPDVHLLMPNVNSINYTKNDFLRANMQKIESLYQINNCHCEILIDSTFEEEDKQVLSGKNNLIYSISQESYRQQYIKSIHISITSISPKNKLKEFDFLKISQNFTEYYYYLFKEIYELNLNSSQTFSLYTKAPDSNCPIPINILYSYNKNQEEDMISQRLYFHKMLNLPKDMPIIQIWQMVDDVAELEQCCEEYPSDYKEMYPKMRKVHQHLKNILNNCLLVKGNYDFYHVNSERMNDYKWGNGYRALQTLLSYFKLNGYINIEIPKLSDIQDLLVYLGQRSNDNRYNAEKISMENAAMCMSYFHDINIEIFYFRSRTEFESKIDLVYGNLNSFSCPIVLSTGNSHKAIFYTIIGIKQNENHMHSFLILRHDYSGRDTLLNLSDFCQWVDLTELFEETDNIEIMLLSPDESI